MLGACPESPTNPIRAWAQNKSLDVELVITDKDANTSCEMRMYNRTEDTIHTAITLAPLPKSLKGQYKVVMDADEWTMSVSGSRLSLYVCVVPQGRMKIWVITVNDYTEVALQAVASSN